MDFDQGLVGPVGSVERGSQLRWRNVETAVQPGGVVPVHPAQGGQLDVVDGLPRPRSCGSIDELALVIAVHGLRQGAIDAFFGLSRPPRAAPVTTPRRRVVSEFCQLALPRPPNVRLPTEILTKLLQEAVNLSVASQVETPPCDRKIDQGQL